MATRFYFDSTTVAAISPAFDASWTRSNQAVRRRLNRTTQASAMTEMTRTDAGAGTTTVLAAQFVIPGLAAQTISGTIKGQVRVSESATGLNATLAVRVAKCASDATGVTEILAIAASDNTAATPPELPTGGSGSEVNRGFQDSSENFSIAISSTGVSDNDALMVEVGYRATGGNNSRNGFFSVGDDNGTDLPEDTTTTAANNPWIEFSGAITFFGEGGGRTTKNTRANPLGVEGGMGWRMEP